jgi:hypothetical protein
MCMCMPRCGTEVSTVSPTVSRINCESLASCDAKCCQEDNAGWMLGYGFSALRDRVEVLTVNMTEFSARDGRSTIRFCQTVYQGTCALFFSNPHSQHMRRGWVTGSGCPSSSRTPSLPSPLFNLRAYPLLTCFPHLPGLKLSSRLV